MISHNNPTQMHICVKKKHPPKKTKKLNPRCATKSQKRNYFIVAEKRLFASASNFRVLHKQYDNSSFIGSQIV